MGVGAGAYQYGHQLSILYHTWTSSAASQVTDDLTNFMEQEEGGQGDESPISLPLKDHI